jgi:predicted RNase H-like nuclease
VGRVIVAGVDGRRGGWAVALVEGTPLRAATVRFLTVDGQDAAGLADVLARARAAGARKVGIDVPIGLPADDWRPVDRLAKRRLGRASARVFLAPPRAVLAAPTYADARRVCREVTGRGCSAQAYGIRRVVLAVDDLLAADPGAADLVVEVHPELSFMALSGRAPGDPLPSKRTASGRAARVAALRRWWPEADEPAVPGGDDGLDAVAAAWSAGRAAAGAADVLGGELDERGLPMQVVV